MTAIPRLLRIELRRNPGLWLFPVMIGLAWWMGSRTDPNLPPELVFWPETAVDLKNSVVLVGPFVGGLAAWMAGRARRHGMGDLLEITPRPPAVRDLALFSGTALWGFAAYVLTAVVLAVVTYQRGAWGSPDVPVALVGLFGIGASGAAGYAAGCFIRSRYTAPLTAIALFGALQLPSLAEYSGVRYLSPLDWSSPDVLLFWGQPNSLLQSLWLIGLTGVALTAVAFLKGQRGVLTRGALVTAAAVSMAGAAPLIILTDTGDRSGGRSVPAYEPVCMEEGVLPVCVHPSYRSLLPEAGPLVERLAAPLAGIPGGPVRAAQVYGGDRGLTADGTLGFNLFNAARLGVGDYFVQEVAGTLAVGRGPWRNTESQAVLMDWLMMEAGFTDSPYFAVRGGDSAEQAALERFAALDPEVRRAWLTDNYAALRVGDLTLEDLP